MALTLFSVSDGVPMSRSRLGRGKATVGSPPICFVPVVQGDLQPVRQPDVIPCLTQIFMTYLQKCI